MFSLIITLTIAFSSSIGNPVLVLEEEVKRKHNIEENSSENSEDIFPSRTSRRTENSLDLKNLNCFCHRKVSTTLPKENKSFNAVENFLNFDDQNTNGNDFSKTILGGKEFNNNKDDLSQSTTILSEKDFEFNLRKAGESKEFKTSSPVKQPVFKSCDQKKSIPVGQNKTEENYYSDDSDDYSYFVCCDINDEYTSNSSSLLSDSDDYDADDEYTSNSSSLLSDSKYSDDSDRYAYFVCCD